MKISEFGVGAVLANSTTREDRFVITLVYISVSGAEPSFSSDRSLPYLVLILHEFRSQ